MRKLYALLVTALLLMGVMSSGAQAQSYSLSSYLVRSETQNWTPISGTEIQELHAGGYAYNYYYVSNEITMPFNFRYVNMITNKVKVTANGNVVMGGSATWDDGLTYNYGGYSGTELYYPQNSYPQWGYGYYPNQMIAPWTGGYQLQTSTTSYQYTTLGSAPNRRFIAQTTNRGNYFGNTTGSWQVELDEAGISTIHLRYGPQGGSGNWSFYGYYPVTTGIKTTGYGNGIISILRSNPSTVVPNAPTYTLYGYYDNEYQATPTVDFKIFIAYPYDFAAKSIDFPVNQSILLANQTIYPTATVSNEGSSVPTSVTVVRQIWKVGDAAPLYTSTVTLTGAAIPQSFTTTSITFDPFPIPAAPGGYGIYEDSLFITTMTPVDQYTVNNLATSEFTVSPPNNIKALTVTGPAPSSRTPINVATPISGRFKNIGANGQTNVPVSAVIRDPNGNVIYRDTAIIANWPSGVIYDTSFKQYTFTQNGNYKLCIVSIMTTDQLRADDTACSAVLVRYEADVAATGVFNPQADEEKPYTKVFKPVGIFQSVGVSDLFDVPARVQIRRCSDGALVFQADSTIPELNVDAGQVKFGFPTKQGNYDITKLTPGCYTQCVIARYPTDGDHTNDTACTTFSIIDRLKGNIFVGVGQRFQTLTAAVDSMRFRGIGGNLNLIMTDANYTESGATDASSNWGALDFAGITGTADTAVVTLKPVAGVSPTITFSGNKPYCFYFGYHAPGYFKFDGMNLIVPTPDQVIPEANKRGVTVVNNSTTAGAVFGFEYGPSNLVVRNMKLIGNGQFTNDSSAIFRLYDETTRNSFLFLGNKQDTTVAHNITIENNQIGNAKYGISELGLAPAYNLGYGYFVDHRDYSNSYKRNTIGTSAYPIGFAGISYDHVDNIYIGHNEISWVNGALSGASYAIGVQQTGVGNATGVWIDGNKIHNITSATQADGIGLQQNSTIYTNGTGVNRASSTLPFGTRNRITNNMIFDLRTTPATGACYPIFAQTGASNYFTDRDSVFQNTIAVSYATVNILLNNQAHPFVFNNIFQNTNTPNRPSTNYVFGVPRPFVPQLNSDYNLFDLRGSNVTFANVSEYDKATGTFIQSRTFRRLNDWRTFTNQDVHSVTGDPLFTSDTAHLPNALNYVVSPASNNGVVLNTATQLYDFDGDQRFTGSQTPDIGADEFEGFQFLNDVGVLAITAPGGYSTTSDTTFVTTDNPLPIYALLKNFGSQISPSRVVTAKLEVAISGGPWTQIWTASQTYSFDLNETHGFGFTGPALTQAQAQNGVFRLTVSNDNDQNNSNNSQQKIFRVLVKNRATIVSFESTTLKGLQNRDSVTAGLRRLGVPYDSLDRSAYTSIDVDYSPWWTLIWATGDPTSSVNSGVSIGGISFKNTEEIERYLGAGQSYAKKSFIIAGQNVALYNDASNINGNGITDTLFMHQYMHTRFVGTTPNVGGYTGYLSGQQVYFTFQDWISCTSPDVVKSAQVTGPLGNDIAGTAYTYLTHASTPSDSGAGTTWHGTTYNVVFFAFDWADAVQTNPGEMGALTSGTTRILRGALDFLTAFRGTILPVEFVNVTASAENNGNLINWQVARQKDVDHYDVEAQLAGAWTSVGHVQAAQSETYSFVDGNVRAGKTYSYRIVSIDLNGARTTSQTVNVARNLPSDFTLGQNYPNPFNPTTTISYTLPSNSVVTLKVIDVTGKVVRTEMNATSQTAGEHSYLLSADDLASGTYVYQLTATAANGQSVVLTKKMTLNK